MLFVILNILTVAIPLLLCYWYPSLKRWFYFNFCAVTAATHFYIVNYDDVVTIVEKEQGHVHLSNVETEDTMFFVNRFLKYYYDVNEGCFTPVTYNYLPRMKNLINTHHLVGYKPNEVAGLRDCFG